MAFGITIDWNPEPIFMRLLFWHLAAEMENMQGGLEEMKSFAAAIMPRNIENEGDGSWPPLSDATLERKTGSSMLIESGEMLATLSGTDLWSVEGDSLVAHNPGDPHYLSIHLSGSVFMPVRDFAYFNQED